MNGPLSTLTFSREERTFPDRKFQHRPHGLNFHSPNIYQNTSEGEHSH